MKNLTFSVLLASAAITAQLNANPVIDQLTAYTDCLDAVADSETQKRSTRFRETALDTCDDEKQRALALVPDESQTQIIEQLSRAEKTVLDER